MSPVGAKSENFPPIHVTVGNVYQAHLFAQSNAALALFTLSRSADFLHPNSRAVTRSTRYVFLWRGLASSGGRLCANAALDVALALYTETAALYLTSVDFSKPNSRTTSSTYK